MPPIPSALTRGLRVGAVLIAALIVQEFAVRLALPDFDPSTHVRFLPGDSVRPILGTPNSRFRQIKNSGDYNVEIVFNRFGLRDTKDVSTAQPEDILLVGDSFGFGWGVETPDRISEQVEAITGRRVFNVAAPNDVDGYVKLLNYAASLGAQARNVILVLNMTDDLREYGDAIPIAAGSPEGAERPTVNFSEIKSLLLAHSALYFLSTTLINQSSWLKAMAVRAGIMLPLAAIPGREISDAAMASTADEIGLIARQYHLIVLVVPSRNVWIGAHRQEEVQINDRFVDVLRRHGIETVDLKDIQERSDGDPMRYHFANDGHWRAIGHRLAAEASAKALTGAD